MSTTDKDEDHATEQSTPVEDIIPIFTWLKPKPTLRKNLIMPLLQQTTAPDDPPSPLNLHSPSPNMQHGSGYEDNDEDESNEHLTLSETLQVEWDCFILKRMNGSSLVHKHAQLCKLKHVININGNRAFSRKLKECPGGHMACLIFKEEGKRLDKYLIKMPPGKKSNGITHLKMHKKILEAQGKAESKATKRKMKGNDKRREAIRQIISNKRNFSKRNKVSKKNRRRN